MPSATQLRRAPMLVSSATTVGRGPRTEPSVSSYMRR